jgi:hypothetical protein
MEQESALRRPIAVAAVPSVAESLLAAPVAGAGDANQQSTYPGFNGEAPLWFYIVAESELNENGVRLGDVGGRIVAEAFLDQLAVDPASYLNATRPFTAPVEHEGAFTRGDSLTFAGVVELEEEAP